MERLFCNNAILREVAAELGLTIEQVRAIVNSQSDYTKEVMESSTFDSVRWPYLGRFVSKPKEIVMINYIKGMTPDQAKEFKHAVRTGKIKLTIEK